MSQTDRGELVFGASVAPFATYSMKGSLDFTEELARTTGQPETQILGALSPVSLSVVYMEIARRLDLPIYGVGLPGHFVVKYEKGRRRFFIDPFHDGRMLNRQGCRRLVKQIHGEEIELSDLDFAALDVREIVIRMASNLRDVYLSTRQYRYGIVYHEVLMALGRDDPSELRVRAWILGELGRRREAIEDLEQYLEVRSEAADAEETREMLLHLKRGQALLN